MGTCRSRMLMSRETKRKANYSAYEENEHKNYFLFLTAFVYY